MSLRIAGRVIERAASHHPPTGSSVLTVLVEDGRSDKPYLAEICYGQGGSASIAAHAAANRLSKGTPVVLEGDGLKDCRWHQQWVRKVVHCRPIEVDVQPARHEPATAADAA